MFFQYLSFFVVNQTGYLFFLSPGGLVLPAGCAEWYLSRQYEGLGLYWRGVAHSGSLWPIDLHDPPEAIHLSIT